MHDFATLTIQRRLSKGTGKRLYWTIYTAQRNGYDLVPILKKAEEDPRKFGTVRFVERDGIYFEHSPNDEEMRNDHQLICRNNIAPEWLICFAFQEMNVIGLDMGIFEAECTIEDAMGRLRWTEISDFDLSRKRDALYIWLKENASGEDRLHLCSNWLFHHPDGKYDYQFVRQHINQQISHLKQTAQCQHWKKSSANTPVTTRLTA